MKIFVICSSEFLPPPQNRDPNSIYFLYDTLDIYFGRTQYHGLYCIVTEIPDGSTPDNQPVKNMLYIKMNGDVWKIDNEIPVMVAQLADPSQAEYLIKAGTSFLLRSGYRYIDHQTKVLSLPYQNGTYQLSVMVDKPIKIDEHTIIVYNPETGEFEIDGDRYYDEYGRNPEILKYTGDETDTIKTFIQNDHIHADVKISPKAGNILHVRGDGLYANTKEFVSAEEFDELVTRTQSQIASFTHFLDAIQDALINVDITLSDETLRDKIIEEIEKYKPTIEEAVDNYEQVVEEFHHTEAQLIDYITENIEVLKVDTIQHIEDVHSSWGYFVDDFETTIEKISEGNYKLTVSITPDSSHKLYYKSDVNKVYFENEQDISSLGFTEFVNEEVVSATANDNISIAYCNITSGSPLVESCSYCIAE